MTERFAVAATDAAVREAAEDCLRRGGGATSAALVGYFTAAGQHAGVLLGGFGLLASNGAACRAFDGRLHQPGLGARRPRGFTQDQEVPVAARLATPRSLAAASLAIGYAAEATWTSSLRAGINAARHVGSERRLQALEAASAQGGIAFSRAPFDRHLLGAGAPSAGGALTRDDLEEIGAIDVVPERLSGEDCVEHRVNWSSGSASGSAEEADATAWSAERTLEALCVVDRAGEFAALVYERARRGVDIAALGLVAPLAATPVLRGVTRASPGAVLSLPAAAAVTYDLTSRAVRADIRTHLGADSYSLAVEREPSSGAARVSR